MVKCIILLKAKLYSMDNIIPLIYELKSAEIVTNPLFVAPDKKTYEIIKKNTVLFEGVCFIGGKLIYINRWKNRYLRLVHNLFVLRIYLFRRILTVAIGAESKLISLLKSFNKKIWRGKTVLTLISNFPLKQAKNHRMMYRIILGAYEKREKDIRGNDLILSSYTKEQYEEIHNVKMITDCPIIRVGYTRGLKEWQKYLEKNASKYIHKYITTPYIFYPLSQLGNGIRGEDCPPAIEILTEAIHVLKNYKNKFLTVFKPHPTTDVDKLKALLNSTDFKNYVISYIHPVILIKNARFIFCNTVSTLLIEAYFHGCPTVEYTHYDSRVYKFTNGQPLYLNCVDYFIHRDKQQLKQVLDKLVYNDIRVERDPKKIKEDFSILTSREIKEKFNCLV